MKPRCDQHGAPLRYSKQYKAWICMAGTRDRTCKPFRRDLPGPVKLRVYRPSHVTWDGREILSPADWDRRRVQVWERDGKVCQGEKMTAPGRFERCGKALPDIRFAEIDHIRARGLGGGWRDDRMENLRLLCRPCNQAKGGKRKGLGLAAALYAPVDPQIAPMTQRAKDEDAMAADYACIDELIGPEARANGVKCPCDVHRNQDLCVGDAVPVPKSRPPVRDAKMLAAGDDSNDER